MKISAQSAQYLRVGVRPPAGIDPTTYTVAGALAPVGDPPVSFAAASWSPSGQALVAFPADTYTPGERLKVWVQLTGGGEVVVIEAPDVIEVST